MTPFSNPVARAVGEFGPDNRVFDFLLLCGPLVVACDAAAGRTPLTELLTALYVLTFAVNVVRCGTR